MSLPRANTGVSGNEQLVCMPEVVVPTTLPDCTTLLLAPCIEHASVDGDNRFVKGLRLDGPGKSVGRVLRSTGTC